MTLNEFLAIRDQLESVAKQASKELELYPRDNMGIVLDSARDVRYNELKNILATCHGKRDYLYKNNKIAAKQSLKHSVAERDKKRAEKLAASTAGQERN